MIKASWEGSAKIEGESEELVKVINATMTHLAGILAPKRVVVSRRGPKTAAAPAPRPSITPSATPSATPPAESPPTVAPDAPWVSTSQGVPDSGAPALDRATEEQLAEGADLWMGVLTTWQQGFGEEGVEQPDRVKILSDAMTQGGGRMFAALHHYGGLTRLVRSLTANVPKKRARRLAEHIAQVSSASGIPVISDYLEYDKEYLGEEYRNG